MWVTRYSELSTYPHVGRRGCRAVGGVSRRLTPKTLLDVGRESGPGYLNGHPAPLTWWVMSRDEEDYRDAVHRGENRRAVVEAWESWLLSMADWVWSGTFTFSSVAHHERAEKSMVRLHRVAFPGARFVVAYERQDRGSVHCHTLCDVRVDFDRVQGVWSTIGGFCSFRLVGQAYGAAVGYVIKHAAKAGDVQIIVPLEVAQDVPLGL